MTPWQGPDGERIGEDVAEVLSRPEFRYEPSWFDRFGTWVGEQLERLLGDGGDPDVATPAFSGGAGALVAWVLIALAAAATIAAVAYAVRHRVARRRAGGDEPDVELEHRRSAGEWESEAVGHEAAGRWKEALRARYRELVRTLVDRGQLPDVAGLTTGELRAALERTTPVAAAPFDRVTRCFELAWYADRPVGPEDVAAARDDAASVLAAAPGPRASGPALVASASGGP